MIIMAKHRIIIFDAKKWISTFLKLFHKIIVTLTAANIWSTKSKCLILNFYSSSLKKLQLMHDLLD